ncbi:cytochrome c [uncultured Mameliella sp.]|uniref:c-type cytochrome n=1 Tax=uncultured Mameliella sp. TaxID=1447087 RepID=UPI00260592E9|nr:cytochrome c [uncultured Mameliella sp.]
MGRGRLMRVLALSLLPLPALAGHELDGRDIAAGQAIYAEKCATCHGAKLQGQPDWQTPDDQGIYPAPPHDETGHTWHHSNADLFDYTKRGGQAIVADLGLKSFTSGMPGFGDTLTDEEIWQVLAYIRATWPDRIREIHASRNPPHD